MKWEVGVALKEMTKPPITREQLRDYAEASGDTNPIHLDDAFAQQAGFPSVIVHGMITMAYLADIIGLNFPEEHFTLHRFKIRFKKVTFPGDVLRCGGEVKALDEKGNLTVSLYAENQAGEITSEGEAEVGGKSH